MTISTGSNCGPNLFSPSIEAYEAATRAAKFGVWEFDLAAERLTWSAGIYEIYGIPLDTRLKRQDVVTRYVDESRSIMESMRAESIRTGQGCSFDANIRTFSGESRWLRLWLDVAQENGTPTRIFGLQQDITAEREALDALRRVAEHDALTGLGNRRLFDAHYREIVGDPLNFGGTAALVLIDVDRFKQINDSFGHAAGDECLRRTANRLRRVFNDARLVARIGGDEFAVLLCAPMGDARIHHTLRRATTILAKPIGWSGRQLEISASIGVAILGRPHRRGLADLFAEADAALYAAKSAGRGNTHVFGDLPIPVAARA